MIYLEETLNPKHASPEALDEFVDFSERHLLPLCPRVGARLAMAWTSSDEWVCQATQVLEFDDMEALKAFRIASSQDKGWGEYLAGLEELAPERRSRLLEPLGPVPAELLHQEAAASQESPNGSYLLAILEVGADKMSEFKAALAQVYQSLPVVASWRPIGGNPNQVIDVWKAPPVQTAYQPADDFTKQFFRQVREVAPAERLTRVIALPFSPLR